MTKDCDCEFDEWPDLDPCERLDDVEYPPKKPSLTKLLKRLKVLGGDGRKTSFSRVVLYSDASGHVDDWSGHETFSFVGLKDLKRHLAELPDLVEKADKSESVSETSCETPCVKDDKTFGLRKLLPRLAHYESPLNLLGPFAELNIFSDESGGISDDKGKEVFAFDNFTELKNHLAELPDLVEKAKESESVSEFECGPCCTGCEDCCPSSDFDAAEEDEIEKQVGEYRDYLTAMKTITATLKRRHENASV